MSRAAAASQAVPGPGDAVPVLAYTVRTLVLCAVPIMAVAAVVYLFVVFAPGQEAMTAFAEPGAWSSQRLWFVPAFMVWLLSAWYPARVLLGRRFHPDLLGHCDRPVYARRLCDWLPRSLALAAGLPLALQVAQGEQTHGLGVAMLVATLALAPGLAWRRPLMARLAGRLGGPLADELDAWQQRPGDQFARIDGLGPVTARLIALYLVAGVVLAWALTIWLESLARPLGTPAITLFAMSWWTLLLALVFEYLPKARLHTPGLVWLVPLAYLLFAPFNHNHPVSPASEVARASSADPRRSLAEAWQAWSAAHPGGPVIVVASAGGASRASYWTASLLGMLEAESATAGHPLDRQLFLVSAISGGAVGAAGFVTAVQALPGLRDDAQCRDIRQLARTVPARDDLATLFGMLLLPDAMAHLLPLPWWSADRARALEQVWPRDWQRTLSACQAGAKPLPNAWVQPFAGPGHATGGADGPLLLFGTTLLDNGARAIESPVAMPGVGQLDLTDTTRFDTGGLSLAAAVQNSARFPYMSPPGQVRWVAPLSCPGGDAHCPAHAARVSQVGDGGYVENSGALDLLDALATLEAVATASGRPDVLRERLRVLVIDATPSQAGDWLCTPPGTPGGSAEQPPDIGAQALYLPDLLGPVYGALDTRASRADDARRALLRRVGGCASANFAELRLPDFGPGRQPAMGWLLAPSSLQRMDAALDRGGSDPAIGTAQCVRSAECMLGANLARVRSWLMPPAPASAPGRAAGTT